MHPLFFNLQQLLFPTICEVCDAKLQSDDHFLCLDCTKALPLIGDYHSKNNTEKIFWGRFDFGFAYSLLYFQKENMAQNLIHGFKYKGKINIGEWLGYKLAQQIKQIPMAMDDNVLLPVPLSNQKIAKRGFNQSEVIAQAISKYTGIPIAHELLRIKNTDTQTKKSRFQRYTNMTEAFEVLDAKNIAGKQIILVDDVVTTGATLESCAKAIINIPKVKVSIVCAAISSY
jgi:ComF family protein